MNEDRASELIMGAWFAVYIFLGFASVYGDRWPTMFFTYTALSMLIAIIIGHPKKEKA